jgi:Rieske Fe-S protein
MQSRRAVLGGCAAGCAALALGACAGPGPADPKANGHDGTGADPADDSGRPDTGPPDLDCEVAPGTAEEGWVEIPLADHPGLDRPGASATITMPQNLLYVVIACVAPECWVALWSTCTHGACPIEWDADAVQAWCDCHGSVFAPDGRVLVGPATEPLARFPVGRRGDSLWVYRPL